MKWSRPKGNFIKWQSSHTQEFLEYNAPTGLDWEIGRSFLQLSFPGSTIKYKKLYNRGIKKRQKSRLLNYAILRISKF